MLQESGMDLRKPRRDCPAQTLESAWIHGLFVQYRDCPYIFNPIYSYPVMLNYKYYTLLKKGPEGVLGLRGVTAQGVLWQHTKVSS